MVGSDAMFGAGPESGRIGWAENERAAPGCLVGLGYIERNQDVGFFEVMFGSTTITVCNKKRVIT